MRNNRLKPLDVRSRARRILDGELPVPAGTSIAVHIAREEYFAFQDQLDREDDDRPSRSYIRPIY